MDTKNETRGEEKEERKSDCCVCVCEREKERESAWLCVCECVCVFHNVWFVAYHLILMDWNTSQTCCSIRRNKIVWDRKIFLDPKNRLNINWMWHNASTSGFNFESISSIKAWFDFWSFFCKMKIIWLILCKGMRKGLLILSSIASY